MVFHRLLGILHGPPSNLPNDLRTVFVLGGPLQRKPLSIGEHRRRLEELGDAELVALCQAGDNLAWETLVRRYRRLVYAVPNRARLPEDLVEDIFHTTFARLAERVHAVRDPERIRAWIVTTARRLTVDAIRKRQEERQYLESEEALEGVAGHDELASDAMEDLQERHLVRIATQRLGTACRRLIHLLFYHPSGEAPSYDTISKELGIPVGSIGPTRSRCLQKLGEELEGGIAQQRVRER